MSEFANQIDDHQREYERIPFTIAQLRYERWSDLKNAAFKLKKKRKAPSPDDLKPTQNTLRDIRILERYWAFPGMSRVDKICEHFKQSEYALFYEEVSEILKLLISEAYRSSISQVEADEIDGLADHFDKHHKREHQHYFETLIVDDLDVEEEMQLQENLLQLRENRDRFVYNTLFANTFQDALIASIFNYNLQVCVIRYDINFKSRARLDMLLPFIASVLKIDQKDVDEDNIAVELAKAMLKLRPNIDVYFVTNSSLLNLDDDVISTFRRVFYRKEDVHELHLSILSGMNERFETPFYSALTNYSQKPTSVFHAMPISRGNSIFKSHWIREMGEFYGRNLFLAETSATTGGLDSLLQPTGPMKKAQEKAAKAFGSKQSFFVTNGTSTANKIVQQSLVQPGDYVLVDRDCHKSHHYALVLAGSYPIYLDSFPIQEYSMYGAVPLHNIIEKLEQLKAKGELDRVRMLVLTNCTFDGLVYHVERIMERVLAIKPDMIFLWDEAWFAFAAFTQTYRRRTAMYCANKLQKRYSSPEYREQYEAHLKDLKEGQSPLLPNPDEVKLRVYSTQSTHKTLTSLRQGSMIHVFDEEFPKKRDAFMEAYMTHTSTSPNYQILASLDIGRRQVQFEGFEMVEKSIELAMILRAKVNDHPKLREYFDVLTVEDFIPEKYRESGLTEYYDPVRGWNRLEQAWETDEFVLDPTKINLHIGRTGVDGDTFKNRFLMDKFSIQVNKTSINTVLFMTNIGTTRGSIAYLVSVLLQIAQELDEERASWTNTELKVHEKKIEKLSENHVSLPDFSRFHDFFRHDPDVPGGDIRSAYYLAYDEENYDFIPVEEALKLCLDGSTLVSANFVIPYPPGFPILVPGQVISQDILEFMIALDVKEVHGFRPDLGLQVFTEKGLEKQRQNRPVHDQISI